MIPCSVEATSVDPCVLLAPAALEVANESPASVIEGTVVALEEALVVPDGCEGVCNWPTVLLPTKTGDGAFIEVEEAADGLLSAAIKASIVEEPVPMGVVGFRLSAFTGSGIGGSAVGCVGCVF